MTSRSVQRLVWAILAIALLLLGVSALRRWMTEQKHEPLMDLGALPTFSLVDQTGAPVTNATLSGKIWVADLIFTHCTTFCPQLTGRMKQLSAELPADASVRLLSVSVDPIHDAPDTLRQYITLHGVDTSRWTFVTGAVPTIYTLVKHGFHLPLDSVGGEQTGYPIIHSPRFVLIDKRGHMRGYYNGLQDSARSQILQDIEVLREQE
jgi:protein SCO1/2